MWRFTFLAITTLFLAGCEKELQTKVDDSMHGVALQQRIQRLQQYDIDQLSYLAPTQQQCTNPQQQCTTSNIVKPDGSFRDCTTLVVPECTTIFSQILRYTADTASGCKDNASTFCKTFLAALDPKLKLPASLQPAYGWTLNTAYFKGSQWNYRAEVYPQTFLTLKALLATLAVMPFLYFVWWYYLYVQDKRKKAKEAAESAIYWANWQREKEIEQQKQAEAAKNKLQAIKRQRVMWKWEQRKKRREEALMAEIQQHAEAEKLAEQKKIDSLLDNLIKD